MLKSFFRLAFFGLFLFALIFVTTTVNAQRGGGGTAKPFTVGVLFQPSNNGNDAHLNSNPVILGDGRIDLTNRSNFEVSDLLRASYLSKMLSKGKVFTQRDGKKFKLSKKAFNLTGDQELPVGIVKNLAIDGVPAGATINRVSFVGVFLQNPDYLGGEEPAEHIKSLSLFYYDGISLVKKIKIPITTRVIGKEMLSWTEFNQRFSLLTSIIIKEYRYPGSIITRMQYPSSEDAPGFVVSDPNLQPFNYYLYLVDVPVNITVPTSRTVGFAVTAEEVCQGQPCPGKFFLTIGKNFYLPEDQDAFVVYFKDNIPLFFETSNGPITLYDSTNISWPAYAAPNIQFTGTMK